MILRIGIEVVLAAVTFLAGGLLWQLRKRGKFLRDVMRDEAFLLGFISRATLDSASPMITPFAQKFQLGYAFNIKFVHEADVTSQRRPGVACVLVLLAALTGSYLMGMVYVAITVGVFFLSSLTPIYESARSNALQHVLAIALVLDKWHSEDPAECEEWVERAWALRPLYNAVKLAR